jgi:serine/threonine protein kinase
MHYSAHKDWFAPPERKQSRQGDIYSLGVIAFMLMTNKIPSYDGTGNPYLSELDLIVPKPIRDILGKMLHMRAAKRYPTVQQMLDEHADYLASLEKPRVKPLTSVPASRRNQSYGLAALIAVAGILGVLLALFWEKLF